MAHKPYYPAKITPPELSEIYIRKRLFRLIDQWGKRPIMWVSGPAGSGKTTLVAGYLAERNLKCIWYRMDERDGDPAAFFHYLGLAAKNIRPCKPNDLPVLTPDYLPALSAFTQMYFESLFNLLNPPLYIVFDNYQDIPSSSFLHEILPYVFSNFPSGYYIAFLSRTDPPPEMSRLRAGGSMMLLRWNDLRLRCDESYGIAKKVGAVKRNRLKRQDIERYHEQVDGWTAGLILLLEENIHHDDSYEYIQGRSRNAIFDYFAGEIFRKSGRDTQEFLMNMAYLPTVTIRTAEELTGFQRADVILSELFYKNYFIERMASQLSSEPVYRFHPLFREFLLNRSEALYPQVLLRKIKQKAASILLNHGQIEEAVSLLQKNADPEEVSEAIIQYAPSLYQSGRYQTLLSILNCLPHEYCEGSPWLMYWHGACLTVFNPAEARAYYEKAFKLFKLTTDAAGLYLSATGVIETLTIEYADFKPLTDWLRAIESLIDNGVSFPSAEIENRVTFMMFIAILLREPWHSKISIWIEKVMLLQHNSNEINQRVMAACYLCYYYAYIGNFSDFALILKTWDAVISFSDITPTVKIHWYLFKAVFGWYTMSNEIWREAVNEGTSYIQKLGARFGIHHIYSQGCFGSLSNGNIREAEVYLKKMKSILEPQRMLEVSHYHYLSGWCSAVKGDMTRAIEDSEIALKLAEEAGSPFPMALTSIDHAGYLLDQGETHKATELIDYAMQIARRMRSIVLEVKCYFVIAELNDNILPLQHAFTLAREHGFVNLPGWRHDMMARLCVRALEAGIEVEYVKKLVRSRNLVPKTSPVEIEAWPWPVKIYTLGRFSLIRDDKPVSFSGKIQKKPLEMLKVIIALGGRRVREDNVVDILWPDTDGISGRRVFATTLCRLKKLIGNEKAVQHNDGVLTLDPRFFWVDIWAFERFINKANDEENAGRLEDAVKWIEKGINLYRGSFLSEHAGANWTLHTVERLCKKYICAMETMGQYWHDKGHPEKAVDYYSRILEVDNFCEDAYRQLISCYHYLGRRGEAVALYHQCKKVFSSRLGTTPSPQTEALYRKVILSS